MTYKVGPKGQVVLPKAIRDSLGIRPGDEVFVEQADGEVRIRPARDEPASIRGIFADTPGGMADLEHEHRREIEREEEKIRRWGG